MKQHVGLMLALAILTVVGACAPAANTGGEPAPERQEDPSENWTGPTPEDNLWTRSAILYMDRARLNPRPEDKRSLFNQALREASEGTVNSPGNPKVWFLAGKAHLGLGHYAPADSMFDRAQELYPYYEEVKIERHNAWVTAYNAGVTAMQSGNTQEAIGHLENAALISDEQPGAELQLGGLYAQSGQTDAAIAAYRNALEILRAPITEEQTAEERAGRGRNTEVAAFNLAQILARNGRATEAAQAYREYISRNPENVTAKLNLAIVLTRDDRIPEASEIYAQLLQRTDLSGDEYFTAGIGLFRADKYDQAVDAFRRSISLNPYARDSYYNLANTLWMQSTLLKKAYESASDSASQRIRSEMAATYDALREAALKVLEFDPYNQNTLLFLAQAYSGLADLEADEAQQRNTRSEAVRALDRSRNMPFEISGIQLRPQGGSTEISGELTNLVLDAGTPVAITFTLLGSDGAELASEQVTVAAPEAEQSARFQLSISAQGQVAGWKYSVVE